MGKSRGGRITIELERLSCHTCGKAYIKGPGLNEYQDELGRDFCGPPCMYIQSGRDKYFSKQNPNDREEIFNGIKAKKERRVNPFSSAPECPGIYVFCTHFFEVVYVGKSKNIKKRLRGSFNDAVKKNASISYFSYAPSKSYADASAYEILYINALKPILNKADKYNDLLTIDFEPLRFSIPQILDSVGITHDLPDENRLEIQRKLMVFESGEEVPS